MGFLWGVVVALRNSHRFETGWLRHPFGSGICRANAPWTYERTLDLGACCTFCDAVRFSNFSNFRCAPLCIWQNLHISSIQHSTVDCRLDCYSPRTFDVATRKYWMRWGRRIWIWSRSWTVSWSAPISFIEHSDTTPGASKVGSNQSFHTAKHFARGVIYYDPLTLKNHN